MLSECKYCCEVCKFSTNDKTKYAVHNNSKKHKSLNGIEELEEDTAAQYKCECGFNSHHQSSLSRHKKLCKFVKEEKKEENITMKIEEIPIKIQDDKSSEEIINLKMEIETLKMLLKEKDEKIEEQDEIIKSLEQDIQDQNDIIKQLENTPKEEPKEDTKQISHYEIIIKEKDVQIQMLKDILNTAMNKQPDDKSNKKQSPPFNIKTYLNNECKNSLSIEKCINKHIQEFTDDYFVHISEQPIKKTLVDAIKRAMNKIPSNERPIQVSDFRNKHFYYKYNDEWIDSKQDIKTFNKLINTTFDLIWRASKMWKNKYNLEYSNGHKWENTYSTLVINLSKDIDYDSIITAILPMFVINK